MVSSEKFSKIEESKEESRKEIEKINQVKDFLLETSLEVIDYDNIHELLEKILVNAIKILDVSESGSILLLDEETGYMTPKIIIGLSDTSKNVKVLPEDTFHFYVSKDSYKSTVIIQDLIFLINSRQDRNMIKIYTDKDELIKSTISAPLFVKGQRYGSINIDSKKLAPFSEFHKTIMDYIARIVEMILERFIMIDEIKFLSTHDYLTRLGNRSSMYNYLDKKIKNKESFHMVQIDLNNFKEINDKYGHLVGDDVLISYGKSLKKLDSSYEPIRLGGDEFALIFENKNKKEIENVLKKFYKECKSNGITIESGKNFKCGFSWGIAKYPEDGDSIEAIYSKSDEILYDKKRKTLRRRKTDG